MRREREEKKQGDQQKQGNGIASGRASALQCGAQQDNRDYHAKSKQESSNDLGGLNRAIEQAQPAPTQVARKRDNEKRLVKMDIEEEDIASQSCQPGKIVKRPGRRIDLQPDGEEGQPR